MKVEFGIFYLSIDKHGFYFEFGNIDTPTPLFSIILITKWWDDF